MKITKTQKTIKDICYYGLGIALYIVLSMVIRVPVFENFYICLGYVTMLAYCYLFGPIGGMVVGGMGCFLYCVLTNGLRGMPGWMLGNIFVGVVLGLWFKKIKNMKNKKILINILTIILIIGSTAIAMLVIKSLTECFLYAQPFIIRVAKNIYAFVADAVVLVASLPICPILHKHIPKIN